MRKAFIDILEEQKNKNNTGFGIPSIPSLVTSNKFCIVKGNGIPFLPIKNKDEWVATFSTRHNSAKLILELIWSKISFYFDMRMPWDDGLHMDSIEPLLLAKAVRVGDRAGWMYNSIELKESRLEREDVEVWKPASLMKSEISAINIMAMQGGYLPLDEGMDAYLKDKHQTTLDEVSQKLILTRLFMKDGEYIRPIHPQTYVLNVNENTGYASSERDRFDLWCEENGLKTNYMVIVFLE
ncbi:hypothetical protein [Diaphorobacter sp. HDW4A]|uniref:hypothetical protein n=1 Tax=Diaphorobacter sp. HDW4A TaxID=2714924 RepID=UPI001980BD38|nr:hypothetical protein [Diaphorobacter sp. HDW4A]